MIANGARVLAMPIAWVMVVNGYSIMALVVLAIIAEAIGYLMSLYLVKSRVKIDLGPTILPLILTTVTLALIAVDLMLYPPQNGEILGHAHWFQLAYMVADCPHPPLQSQQPIRHFQAPHKDPKSL